MVNSLRVYFALSLVGLLGGGNLRGQTPGSVSLLCNSDPGTLSLLAGRFMNVYQNVDPSFQGSLYLLRNDSGLVISSYVVKWVPNSSSGLGPFFQAFDENELLLKPARKVSGKGIEPGKLRVLTPFMNIHESEASDLEVSTIRHFQANPIGRRLAGTGTWAATLDLVVYADGSYEGPDESGASEAFMLERNGKHDAGASVLLAIGRGDSDAQIRSDLQGDIDLGSGTSSSKGRDGYLAARARWASVLLQISDGGGTAQMNQAATDYARVKRVRLVRRMGPNLNLTQSK